MRSNRRRVLIGLAIAALLGASARTGHPMRVLAYDDKGPEPAHQASDHVDAAVPGEYVSVTVPPALWANPAVLARGWGRNLPDLVIARASS